MCEPEVSVACLTEELRRLRLLHRHGELLGLHGGGAAAWRRRLVHRALHHPLHRVDVAAVPLTLHKFNQAHSGFEALHAKCFFPGWRKTSQESIGGYESPSLDSSRMPQPCPVRVKKNPAQMRFVVTVAGMGITPRAECEEECEKNGRFSPLDFAALSSPWKFRP